MSMKVRFPDEDESYLDSASVGGSFKSFFKHLGKDIKNVSKKVGNTAVNIGSKAVNQVGNDLYNSGKSAIAYGI
jgi:hypothetical protein